MSGIIQKNAGRNSGVIGSTAAADPTYVQFPGTQVSSADVNRLDDYEEGTFTPDIIAATNNDHVRTTQIGFYTKIGDTVHLTAHYVHYAAGTSSGNVTVGGFPFTQVNISGNQGCIHFGHADSLALGAAGYSLAANGATATAYCHLKTWDGTGGTSATQFSEMGDYNTISWNLTYKTAT